MIALPADNASSTPVPEPIAATELFVLVQVPPPAVLVRLVSVPEQKVLPPPIAEGAGVGFTFTLNVALADPHAFATV